MTQAAREAGRAYATAGSSSAGLVRARYAARLALADQGLPAEPEVRFAPIGTRCGRTDPGDGAPSLRPGARFVVCVRTRAPLPLAAGGPLGGAAGVTVDGQFTVVVDTYRGLRP